MEAVDSVTVVAIAVGSSQMSPPRAPLFGEEARRSFCSCVLIVLSPSAIAASSAADPDPPYVESKEPDADTAPILV